MSQHMIDMAGVREAYQQRKRDIPESLRPTAQPQEIKPAPQPQPEGKTIELFQVGRMNEIRVFSLREEDLRRLLGLEKEWKFVSFNEAERDGFVLEINFSRTIDYRSDSPGQVVYTR